ncbi:AzlC family ABC transporter permease [Anaerovorax odorimutans]|uniref:AzlC family ABC transporter permease n=1 Tax=Anaerovorax odorimutans TaxID=109327 RepID=UPI00041039B8|nr:AzlC family ABC transporter permease [Anaerovorax odorimutans]
MKQAIKAAFPITIPVFLGYIPLGIAFGLLIQDAGYGLLWAIISSISIYSGTGQFVEVNFLSSATPLLEITMIIIILNARLMFYGLSFIDTFQKMGKKKWYIIFALTDETYSILCAIKPPEDVDEDKFMFALSMMNHLYWIIGGIIGVIAGSFITINTAGMDFIMTALFVVLCMDQWKAYACHEPVFAGFICSVMALLIFGPEGFMIPSMIAILIVLLFRRKKIEEKMINEPITLDENTEKIGGLK